MSSEKMDERRDLETGQWVSDLEAGASTEAKVDKAIKDTFPASDPVQETGVTGFILPDGEDTAEGTGERAAEVGMSVTSTASAYVDSVLHRAGGTRASAVSALNNRPLAALLIAGAAGWCLGLLANSRR